MSKKKKMPLAGTALLFLAMGCLLLPTAAWAGSNPKPASKEEERISGKWLRPDGGYVLQLSEVKQDGTLKAAYFNPRLIHVAKAQWKRIADRIQVFVEFQDINYPGSTYTIIYDPKQDQFTGYYFQAALGQTFDVLFVRKQ